MAKASDHRRRELDKPQRCPTCKSSGLVPAITPVAKEHIGRNAEIAGLAAAQVQRVLLEVEEGPPAGKPMPVDVVLYSTFVRCVLAVVLLLCVLGAAYAYRAEIGEMLLLLFAIE